VFGDGREEGVAGHSIWSFPVFARGPCVLLISLGAVLLFGFSRQ
jgi:hypothetical protein